MMHFLNATDVLTNRVNCSGSTLNLTLFWRLVRDLRALLFSLLFLSQTPRRRRLRLRRWVGCLDRGCPRGWLARAPCRTQSMPCRTWPRPAWLQACRRSSRCHKVRTAVNRARKSRVYLAWRHEIQGIIVSLGTVRAQPHFRSHVKSMGDFRLLQITVI